jgi:hypothetical protein
MKKTNIFYGKIFSVILICGVMIVSILISRNLEQALSGIYVIVALVSFIFAGFNWRKYYHFNGGD